ncbi:MULTISPECIES: aspartate-semialdehyde dehydrogenase [Methanobrevibacter]|uniref:Aspartate-semialdehyde dehydrogenase n=1 Tax=Methanobrevibacter gottschalkii DSM 11977 TaxID=1122229 RepID=A0A3N5B2Q2_9EURY|nr:MULTISPECIES: aspartate-semialdehyde dehydrogenase [Methanobrevibacter]OEC96838.1 aspartate-semialdehyde dehydrogenase [Methanobrevibacter sp. A27]RPF51557.1 aspartate-semialdehyde dehydrogenase [Methanobrevibacter gottschalkii DSM 11977]
MVKVGVLGATGMVGQRFIQLLENHPDFEVTALAASSRSAGKRYEDATTWYLDSEMPNSVKDIIVCETNLEDMDNDIDIIFSSLPTEFASKVEKKFAKDYVVASNASAHRMKKNIPLVIPEVNPEYLDMIDAQQKENNWDGFIVTNPNCSTIALTLTLKPIVDNFNVNSIRVSTMQAVSGAGYNGVPSMAIVDNLVPYIGNEEEKMESETLHLLGSYDGNVVTNADFRLSASCHRVPVIDGHTEAVFVELDDEFDIGDVKNKMANFKALPQKLNLFSAPENPVIVKEENDRPQPRMDRNAGNGMAVTVGRMRKDKIFENSFKYVLVGHNTIRGAAGASILNAELINDKIL